jgi:hypothetical protein
MGESNILKDYTHKNEGRQTKGAPPVPASATGVSPCQETGHSRKHDCERNEPRQRRGCPRDPRRLARPHPRAENAEEYGSASIRGRFDPKHSWRLATRPTGPGRLRIKCHGRRQVRFCLLEAGSIEAGGSEQSRPIECWQFRSRGEIDGRSNMQFEELTLAVQNDELHAWFQRVSTQYQRVLGAGA